MEEKDKKNESTIDKIIMGAIIGTAIGSAVGMSLAPKKGEETRKMIKKESKEYFKLAKETIFGILKITKKILLKSEPSKSAKGLKEIPDESEMEIIEPNNEKKN